MKKLYIVLIVALWAVMMPTFARTAQEAALVASQFISQSQQAPALRMQRAAAATGMATPVELAYTQYQINNITPAVFVFNDKDSEGFVLVSASDESRAILGYSDKGRFDQESIPENMQFWLQMYADELARYEANKPVLQAGQTSMSGKKRAASATYPTIAPILGSVEWGQNTPYNNLCPKKNGQRCVTGCVATAISQIMYVHKYPTKGTGSHSYTGENGVSASANFGATTYDWNNMLPSYANGYNTTQATAVATLMYHVGVAANMEYDPNGSGAVSSIALANLATYFDYDAGIQTWPKDYMQEEDILNAIAEDLQIGHPVYISGSTKNQEGHAFVCDGMQSTGYLHINWGWNGVSNGYYALSALAPEQQGTGGSSSDLAFTEGVDVNTGIQPDKGGVATALITIDALKPSANEFSRNAKVTFDIERFTSSGMATASGVVCFSIYDKTGNLVNKVEVGSFELPTGYLYPNLTIGQAIPSSLAAGEYELEVGYTDNANKLQSILVKGKGVVRFPMTVTSSKITFSEGTGSGTGGGNETTTAAYTGVDISYIQNSANNTWAIDLYSSYFWNDYESDDEVLLRFEINSGSKTSVIGTYVLDNQNSGAAGTINTGGLYAVGYYQACYQYAIQDMHLTITDAGDGKINMEYYVVANGETQHGSITIAEPNWYLYDSTEDKYYYYHTYVTTELASTIPASRALNLTQGLSHTNETEMSYFVNGIISTMRNTPDQIAQYKTARFDMSDDGTISNQFYCYNTKWLNNTEFSTGNEIALGDTIVVYGPLQNYNGNTPEIKGYIYQHTPNKQIDYSIKNLEVKTVGNILQFSFESEAPYFHVKLTKDDGTTIANQIIGFKTASIELENGIYTLWIRPVDETQQYYLADAVEETFAMEAIDYSIYNLNISTEGNTVHFSFESEAPNFHVKITSASGSTVADDIIDFKSVYLKDLADGLYTLWIRPVDEALEYYIGEAVEAEFEINTTTTGIENLEAQETVVLYDLVGRVVDRKMSGDNRAFNVPMDGVYIQRSGNKTHKIYIKKQ